MRQIWSGRRWVAIWLVLVHGDLEWVRVNVFDGWEDGGEQFIFLWRLIGIGTISPVWAREGCPEKFQVAWDRKVEACGAC